MKTDSERKNLSYNLLVWRWTSEYSDKNKQRREKLTHQKVANAFIESGDHHAVGLFDQDSFMSEVEKLFPGTELGKPFVVERYEKGIVFNYGSNQRMEVASAIGQAAMKMNLNGTEC